MASRPPVTCRVKLKKAMPGPQMRGIIFTAEVLDTDNTITFWDPEMTIEEARQSLGQVIEMERQDSGIAATPDQIMQLYQQGRLDELQAVMHGKKPSGS